MYIVEPGTPLWKYPEPDISPPDDDIEPLYCEDCGEMICEGDVYYVWGRSDEIRLCEACMEEAQRAASRVRGEED